MGRENKYVKSKHDSYITCHNCNRKNAPQSSSDFRKYCYNCNVQLNTEAPVSKGDIVKVFVDDIHREGHGVGKMDNGFVVLVKDAMPEQTVKVKIENVRDTSAVGTSVEKGLEDPDYVKNNDKDNQEEGNLGSRDNYWGK